MASPEFVSELEEPALQILDDSRAHSTDKKDDSRAETEPEDECDTASGLTTVTHDDEGPGFEDDTNDYAPEASDEEDWDEEDWDEEVYDEEDDDEDHDFEEDELDDEDDQLEVEESQAEVNSPEAFEDEEVFEQLNTLEPAPTMTEILAKQEDVNSQLNELNARIEALIADLTGRDKAAESDEPDDVAHPVKRAA
ncbi:MAG: hypothetical protein AAF456_07310 [Planctomycetota bacterium]